MDWMGSNRQPAARSSLRTAVKAYQLTLYGGTFATPQTAQSWDAGASRDWCGAAPQADMPTRPGPLAWSTARTRIAGNSSLDNLCRC